MADIRIGYLSFRTKPKEHIPPLRLRALQAEAILQGAVFVLLDWEHFDKKNRKVLIWLPTSDGWKSEWTTLPDIIIIVGATVNEEQNIFKEWALQDRPCIYDVGINKLSLSNMLADTEYKKYLIPDQEIPKTESHEAIASFLAQNGSSVIKRSNANKGIGLLFILKEISGWRFSSGNKDVLSLDEIVQKIMARIQGRLAYRDFVIQKYIKSVATDGRSADIRVHVQRGSDREWKITRTYVRLAEVGEMATNISRGGYQGPLQSFLKHRKTRPADDIESELTEAAVAIARIQSQASPKPLSELGIDFLLDEKDALWLVETNALPQSAFHEHQRAINTIGYALSLIEKPQKQ